MSCLVWGATSAKVDIPTSTRGPSATGPSWMNPEATGTVFRRGDSGPAVAEIRALLERIGLLGADPVAGTAYDEHVELAVRNFQQQRGLTVDGVVGSSTYRRLDEARWTLGDRVLNHRPGNLMAGDDVFALQQRLLDMGFKVGRVDGYFGPETEDGAAGLPAQPRATPRRHLRPGHAQGARPAAAARERRRPQRDARPGADPQGRPPAGRQDRGDRPQAAAAGAARPAERRPDGARAGAAHRARRRAPDRGPVGGDRRPGVPRRHAR